MFVPGATAASADGAGSQTAGVAGTARGSAAAAPASMAASAHCLAPTNQPAEPTHPPAAAAAAGGGAGPGAPGGPALAARVAAGGAAVTAAGACRAARGGKQRQVGKHGLDGGTKCAAVGTRQRESVPPQLRLPAGGAAPSVALHVCSTAQAGQTWVPRAEPADTPQQPGRRDAGRRGPRPGSARKWPGKPPLAAARVGWAGRSRSSTQVAVAGQGGP